jgi:uncharacterized protein (UPF0335 family)
MDKETEIHVLKEQLEFALEKIERLEQENQALILENKNLNRRVNTDE